METFDKICSEIKSCHKCPLGATRINAVPGEGDTKTALMFIGEAPGADEDAQGRPFVGRAGQLLTKILESVDISRDEVYITNILKCRPPNNRTPLPQEMEACRGHIMGQIDCVRPKLIGALGSVATKFLLGEGVGNITKIRGNWYDFNENIKLMPLYHPSYLLRNPSKEPGSPKHQMWTDIKNLKKAFDEARK